MLFIVGFEINMEDIISLNVAPCRECPPTFRRNISELVPEVMGSHPITPNW
jgi:hypothetical protein